MSKLDKFLGYIKDEAFVKTLLEKLVHIKIDYMDIYELDNIFPNFDEEEAKDRTFCDMDEVESFATNSYEDFYEWCFPEEILEKPLNVDWADANGKVQHANICSLYKAKTYETDDCDFTYFFEILSKTVNDTAYNNGEKNENGLFYGWLVPLTKKLLKEKLKTL